MEKRKKLPVDDSFWYEVLEFFLMWLTYEKPWPLFFPPISKNSLPYSNGLKSTFSGGTV